MSSGLHKVAQWQQLLEESVRKALKSRQSTVSLEPVIIKLLENNREAIASPSAVKEIRAAIQELIDLDIWYPVPKDSRKWTKGWRGLCYPSRVKLEVETKEATFVAWHPFLQERIVSDRMQPTVKKRLMRLNEFLWSRPHDTEPFKEYLGQKERALEVFGDEKALDKMPDEGWSSVRLTRDDLNCEKKPEPVPYEAFENSSRVLLVLENAETYYRACQLNHDLQKWKVVAYGSGNQIVSQWNGICNLKALHDCDVIRYFGDLDLAGLQIADKLYQKILVQVGIQIQLDMSLYQMTYHSDYRVPENRANNVDFDHHKAWIPEAIQLWLDELIESKERMPQEAIGLVDNHQLQ